MLDDAQRRKQKGLSRITNEIKGYDTNKKIISIAAKNIENAGLDEYIKVAHRSIESISDVNEKSGLFIVNPPYGERLGENQNLHKLYFLVGEVLKQIFQIVAQEYLQQMRNLLGKWIYHPQKSINLIMDQ